MRKTVTARNFYKMHGLGNDFVIIDGRKRAFIPNPDQTKSISDRRQGIGCDQVIVLENSDHASVFMRIYNADGSEAEACGNATRCVASLMHKEVGVAPTIETIAGILKTKRVNSQFQVDMGPITIIDPCRAVEEGPSPAVVLSIGNPHCVFLTEKLDLISTVGPKVEKDAQFVDRTNVHFVEILDKSNIRQRVWERGSGLTSASGSGACAGAVAAMVVGGCDRSVTVRMDGGKLEITWREKDGHVLMQGPHTLSFEGRFDL